MLSLPAFVAEGQWRIVASFPKTSVSAVWFLDDVGAPNIGFVGTAGGGFARTTDRGLTWVGGSGGGVGGNWDFIFKDRSVGWAAAPSGVIKTTDAGITWSTTPLTAEIHSIYYHHGRLFANGPNVPAKISDDEGATWYDAGPKKMLGTVFADNRIGFRSSFDSLFEYTNDGGTTWIESAFGEESWQPTYLRKGKSFLVASETFIGTDRIYRSDNGGVSWHQIYDFGPAGRLTGTIRGDTSALYVQTDQGIALSTNGGFEWTSICGPSEVFDTRFWAHGDTVFAGDRYGNLWMTPTGRRGPTYDLAAFSDSALHFFTSACKRAVSSLKIFDVGNCYQYRTDVIQLSIIGGKNRFLLNRPVPLPHFFTADEAIDVVYYPGQDLYDTAELYIQYEKNGEVHDTILPLYGQRIPAAAYAISPVAVSRSVPNPCTIFDTIITITNSPCDTTIINAASVLMPSGTTIIRPIFPVVLPPDSSCEIELQFQEPSKGVYADTLSLNVSVAAGRTIEKLPLLFEVKDDIVAHETFKPSQLQFGRVSVCGPATRWVHIRNPLCRKEMLRRAWLTPANVGFKILTAPALPKSEAAQQDDSILVEFAPTLAGTYSSRLNIEYEFEGVVKDSVIPLQGIGTTSIAANLEDSALEFDSVSTCDHLLRSTYLDNQSCDPFQITEIRSAGQTPFTVLEPSLPCWVQPGEHKKLTVSFASRTVGTSTEVLEVYLMQSNATASMRLELHGESYALTTPPIVSTTALDLGTITPCAFLDTGFSLRNPLSCDSLQVDSVWTSGSGKTSIVAFGASVIPPGGTLVIPVHFGPSADQAIVDSVFVSLHSPYASYDTVVVLRANVVGNTRYLVPSVASYDLGSLSICDRRDTSITLTNDGCDTLTISQGDMMGSGFQIASLALPVRIPPHDSVTLLIRAAADTSLHSLQNRAILTLGGNAINSPTQISFRSTIVYPSNLGLSLRPDLPRVNAGNDLSIAVVANGGVPPDLVTMDMTLAYNSDMLSYIGADSKNTVISADGVHFRITGTPSILRDADSSVAVLRFKTYLTRDSSTGVKISRLLANPSIPTYQECVLSLSASDTAVQYAYGCGDRLLQDVLRKHGPIFEITSLRADKSRDAISVTTYSAITQQCWVELSNSLGAILRRFQVALPAGVTAQTMETGALANGEYVLTLRAGTESTSKGFAVIR